MYDLNLILKSLYIVDLLYHQEYWDLEEYVFENIKTLLSN